MKELTMTIAEDLADQRAVLNYVLSEHPETLTLDELTRELAGDSPEFAQRERIERAVDELVGHGLLRRIDALVLPTRAATHFHGIGDGL
jgi:Fe2+ or Zn2+ uptake regulation protein